ncbi:MAG: hypothetical protein IPF99_31660 [Deltaproteobacteria bacterium]|nr:hypothetical protein [Deltaproteobacteria bacterium]
MDLDGQRGLVVEDVAAVPGSETADASKQLAGSTIAHFCDGRRGSARANVGPSGVVKALVKALVKVFVKVVGVTCK